MENLGMLFLTGLRAIGLALDTALSWLGMAFYTTFLNLSSINLFDSDTIAEFSSRIYAIIAVFMLFKVAFSLLNYIVSPEAMVDKNTGGAKLISRAVIVLVMIVMMPTFFSMALDFQAMIIKNNVIGKLIMGLPSEIASEETTDPEVNPAEDVFYTTLSAFISPNSSAVGTECEGVEAGAQTCVDALNSAVTGAGDSYKNSVESKKISSLFELVSLKKDDKFLFTYQWPVTTASIIFTAWIFALFALDVAVRLVKLGFLQIISPIAIVSYIDPKSGKEGFFKNWLKEVKNTYLSLFIRVMALTFALAIIKMLTETEIKYIEDDTVFHLVTHPLSYALIIWGILYFSKELPKLIEGLTGIKMGDGFSLDPRKKLQKAPIVGSRMAAAVTRGMGLAVAGSNLAKNNVGNKLKETSMGKSASAAYDNLKKQKNERMKALATKYDKDSVFKDTYSKYDDEAWDRVNSQTFAEQMAGKDFSGKTAGQAAVEAKKTARVAVKTKLEKEELWEKGWKADVNAAKELDKKVAELMGVDPKTGEKVSVKSERYKKLLIKEGIDKGLITQELADNGLSPSQFDTLDSRVGGIAKEQLKSQLKSEPAYFESLGYTNKEFIGSLVSIESNKIKVQQADAQASEVQQKYGAMMQTAYTLKSSNDPAQQAHGIQMEKDAKIYRDTEMAAALKAKSDATADLESAKSYHKDVISKQEDIYGSDIELEKAITVGKATYKPGASDIREDRDPEKNEKLKAKTDAKYKEISEEEAEVRQKNIQEEMKKQAEEKTKKDAEEAQIKAEEVKEARNRQIREEELERLKVQQEFARRSQSSNVNQDDDIIDVDFDDIQVVDDDSSNENK